VELLQTPFGNARDGPGLGSRLGRPGQRRRKLGEAGPGMTLRSRVERLKSDQDALIAALGPQDYRLYHQDQNIVAIHPGDPSLGRIFVVPQR